MILKVPTYNTIFATHFAIRVLKLLTYKFLSILWLILAEKYVKILATDDFNKHYHNAANPTSKSYIDKPIAKPYWEKHANQIGPPKLKLEIIDKEDHRWSIDREIKEARFLIQNKLSLNDKSELSTLTQFLIQYRDFQ